MLIYNIKTQVKFDLTELWAFFKTIAHLAGASVSYGHISSCCKATVWLGVNYNIHDHEIISEHYIHHQIKILACFEVGN